MNLVKKSSFLAFFIFFSLPIFATAADWQEIKVKKTGNEYTPDHLYFDKANILKDPSGMVLVVTLLDWDEARVVDSSLPFGLFPIKFHSVELKYSISCPAKKAKAGPSMAFKGHMAEGDIVQESDGNSTYATFDDIKEDSSILEIYNSVCPSSSQVAQPILKADSIAEKSEKIVKARIRLAAHDFRSLDDAIDSLSPILGGASVMTLSSDPLSLKGVIFQEYFRIVQVLPNNDFLLTLSEKHYGDYSKQIFYGYIDQNYSGRVEYIDDQTVAVICQVIGTKSYNTVDGSMKTVPKLEILGIDAMP